MSGKAEPDPFPTISFLSLFYFKPTKKNPYASVCPFFSEKSFLLRKQTWILQHTNWQVVSELVLIKIDGH